MGQQMQNLLCIRHFQCGYRQNASREVVDDIGEGEVPCFEQEFDAVYPRLGKLPAKVHRHGSRAGLQEICSHNSWCWKGYTRNGPRDRQVLY
jgi:hypothetical protein